LASTSALKVFEMARLIDRLTHAGLWCAASLGVAMSTGGVLAQPTPNIAGNYRGHMTSCVVAEQPNICRAALADLVRLAVEVDTKRAECEDIEARENGTPAETTYADYAAALERLNQGITNFNRDVAGPRKSR
jgi:hypothetical protein